MIVGVTGHRPNRIFGQWYTKSQESRLEYFANFVIRQTVPLPKKIITGMAIGWDMAIAVAAYELKIPYISAIPFEGQHEKWGQESQFKYNTLLESAHGHYIASQNRSTSSYFIRNNWIVENSDLILAFWDGNPTGGTYHCVESANRKQVPVLNVYGEFVANGGL